MRSLCCFANQPKPLAFVIRNPQAILMLLTSALVVWVSLCLRLICGAQILYIMGDIKRCLGFSNLSEFFLRHCRTNEAKKCKWWRINWPTALNRLFNEPILAYFRNINGWGRVFRLRNNSELWAEAKYA